MTDDDFDLWIKNELIWEAEKKKLQEEIEGEIAQPTEEKLEPPCTNELFLEETKSVEATEPIEEEPSADPLVTEQQDHQTIEVVQVDLAVEDPIPASEQQDDQTTEVAQVDLDLIDDPLPADTLIKEEEKSNDEKIVVKLFFESNIYRFSIASDCTYDDLKCILNAKIDQGYESAGKLTYVDEEGDTITLTSQEEWEEALRIFSGELLQAVIKLYVV